MPASTQFSIAVHLMAGLGFGIAGGATSTMLAGSVNTSPSFVRRTLAKLSRANLVSTTMGKHGSCSLAKDPGQISLLDIYRAVEAPKAFAIHEYPEQTSCPVSCRIKFAMDNVLTRSQNSFEAGLSEITLADVIGDMKEA